MILLENFTPSTLFIGKRFIYLDEINSTNDYATKMLLREKTLEGTAIFTDSQTNGRGQQQNSWQSEPKKNIAISFILYPNFLPAEKQFYLNQAISLAVFDSIKKIIDGVKIKWPNDILIKGRKTAGILIENSLSGKKINSSIIGIGINVNQISFPDEIKNATSLKIENQKKNHQKDDDFHLLNMVHILCQETENRYLQLREGKYDLLKRDYLNALYCYQELHQFQTSEGIFNGQILGVGDEGKMIVGVNGKLKSFAFKEITFL